MSHARSPSPAAPSPLPTITVALCASAKKHHQSFDALRAAGEAHNARLRAEHEEQAAAAAGRAVRSDPYAGLGASPGRPDNTPPKPRSRGNSRATADDGDRGTPRSSTRTIVNSCLFRFVNLNYDARHHCMVVSADDAVKGVVPEGDPEGSDTATSTGDAAVVEAARLASEVDVVLHKVATFGSPSAIRALERWCKLAQKQRSRQRQTPLVVVDPLEKVQLLMTRSMLYKLLDNTGADGRSAALIPRTFMWDRPTAQQRAAAAAAGGGIGGEAATPLGIHSFTLAEDSSGKEARASGTAQGRWWIAKPDEGTGPAFTHFLVMWRTRDRDVRVPPAVEAVLPKESQRFVLQELYVYALPVVIKVYCIAPHIYIKVNPTANLLAHLWESTRGSTTLDNPVMMDSQDKAFFSPVASFSGTASRPALSQATSGADYAAQAVNERSTTPPPPPPLSSRTGEGTSPLSPPVTLSRAALQSASADPAAVPWEAMVAPGELWDAFLAPGTPAYTAVSKLAAEMSGFGGIGLTMYGFDIVLVPQHLAHAYQRKSTRGIGHTDGATVKYETASTTSPRRSSPATSALTSPAAAAAANAAGAAAPLPFKADDMFDRATGAPTPLLLDSIPVVIDVNYFPGYKGVAEANQHMMELMANKVAKTMTATTSSSARRSSDDATSSRDKKHQCVSM